MCCRKKIDKNEKNPPKTKSSNFIKLFFFWKGHIILQKAKKSEHKNWINVIVGCGWEDLVRRNTNLMKNTIFDLGKFWA